VLVCLLGLVTNSLFSNYSRMLAYVPEFQFSFSDVSVVNNVLDQIQIQSLYSNSKIKATVEAYSYAQSFSNIDRRLLFVHIPKTAGSTMEVDVALGQGMTLIWGRCLFLDGTRGCPRFEDEKFRFGPPKQERLVPLWWHFLVAFWHVPVHYFPLLNLLNNYNPYTTADTFAVIRHPVDRAVSEYHYVCS
jgi:hypothetical protein